MITFITTRTIDTSEYGMERRSEISTVLCKYVYTQKPRSGLTHTHTYIQWPKGSFRLADPDKQ